MAEIQLREAVNRFDVVGILAEKNLEVKMINDKEVIAGDLVIKTAPNSYIKVKVFTNRITNAGTESKSFTAFTTVMNEYKSIAETGNEEEADKVSAFGKLSEGKPFLSQTGEVITSISNQISFISRVTDIAKYEPRAKWQGEVFVQGYKSELKKEDDDLVETGRKLMQVVVPTYGGKVFPMELVLVDIDNNGCIEFFEDNVKRGATVKVYCDLINSTEKIVQGTTTGGFGKKEPQVFTKVINERIAVGADDAYPDFEEGEESQKAYDPKLITQALAIREQNIEEVKNSGGSAPTSKTAFGGSGKPSSTPSKPSAPVDDEIPF